MSQLNPNAAEFVPVSPTRGVESPAHLNFLKDTVIAQSPKRPSSNIDINVPKPQEFECEVKNRPSDLEQISADHSNENGQHLSSQKKLENYLNGKNIDDIDFQPNSCTPNKAQGDEFHFGPNAVPFSTPRILDQSENLSIKAVYGDESSANVIESFISLNESNAATIQDELSSFDKQQDQDPMSLSMYEKNDDDIDDKIAAGDSSDVLNRVQVLPDDIDDFLQKPNESGDDNFVGSFNESISDLPEHDPLEGQHGVEVVTDLPENRDIKTTDLDDDSDDDGVVDEHKQEVVCEIYQAQNSPLLGIDVANATSEVDVEVKVPEVGLSSPSTLLDELCSKVDKLNVDEQHDEQFTHPQSLSPAPDNNLLSSQSPAPSDELICHRPYSTSPALNISSPEPIDDLEQTQRETPEIAELCRFDAAPADSPFEDITSSVKDDDNSFSPSAPEPISKETVDINYAQELLSAVQETVPLMENQQAFSGVGQDFGVNILSPKSPMTDTESVAATDVNSFLNRSEVSNVASPLSSSNNETGNETVITADLLSDTSNKCSYPLPSSFENCQQQTLLAGHKVPDSPVEDATSPDRETSKINNFEQHSQFTDDSKPRVLEINEPVSSETAPLAEETKFETLKVEESQKCDVELKTESETPSLPTAKINEVPATAEIEKESIEEEKTDDLNKASTTAEAVGTALAVAAVAGATIAPIVEERKVVAAKPKPSSATKKTATAVSKAPTAKAPMAAAKTAPKPSSNLTSKTMTTQSKTSVAPKTATTSSKAISRNAAVASSKSPLSKPLTSTLKTSTKTAVEVKTSTTRTSAMATKKTESSTLAKTTSTTGKVSPTKSMVPKSSTTAPAKSTVANTTAPLSRPKTSPGAAVASLKGPTAPKTTSNVNSGRTTSRPATTAAATTKMTATVPPRTRPATTLKPRVPATKTLTNKGPDAEKQMKETVNKQLTATRSVVNSTRTTAAKTTLAAKKTDVKSTTGLTRTTTTKTTTTTLKSTGPKKATTTTTSISKTKTSTKPQENGISIVETIKVTTNGDNIESGLLKDGSPTDIIDNSQVF